RSDRDWSSDVCSSDLGGIVVAANAGSDYLFVPDRDSRTVKAAVVSLQSRLQFGAIFVSDKYGNVEGTLPMSLIKTENTASGRNRSEERRVGKECRSR